MGGLQAHTQGGSIQAHTQGGSIQAHTQGGSIQAHTQGGLQANTWGGGVSQHWGTEADPPPVDGYCSGQYASYWNAFLLQPADDFSRMQTISGFVW